jgi:group I intron endonuclease
MVGIYKITNPKGKIYIGQSPNIEKRFKQYKCLDCKTQPKIYRSLKKYSWENHKFESVEECSYKILDEREIYWINFYNSFNCGLNLTEGGRGMRLLSEEIKNKISKAKKNHPCYKDPSFGKKISKSKKGKPLSKEHIQKLKKPKLEGFGEKPDGFGEKISKIKTGVPNYKGRKPSNWNNKHIISDANSKPVIQYDTEYNIINEFSSVRKAKEFFNGDIGACCRGKQKTSCGYIWKFKTKT